jgi:hypothetical protein
MTTDTAHDLTAHRHLGFCAHCDGQSWASEVFGWRTWAQEGRLGRLTYRLTHRQRP